MPAMGPRGEFIGGALGLMCVLFLPFCCYVIFAVLIGQLAARKGRSSVGWALIALVPLANVAVWYLVGLPDKDLKSRIEELERRLAGR